MSYDYVRRNYPVDPQVGQRVTLAEGRQRPSGVVTRENKSQSHYVMVRFDGQRHASPCHPTSLEYHHAE